ncbi:MAG: heparinase II/III family protein [Desulfomonilaceae bacterium]|jgi:hypothetical protein
MKYPDIPKRYFATDLSLFRSELVKHGDLQTVKEIGSEPSHAVIHGKGKISLSLIPRFSNLESYNSLRLTLINRSEHLILVGLNLIHGAGVPQKDGEGISFSGGREFLYPGRLCCLNFPVESFGAYGKPRGWENISKIDLIFETEKFAAAPGEFEIEFRELEAVKRLVPAGPRLSQDGLEHLLLKEMDSHSFSKTNFSPSSPSPNGSNARRKTSWVPFSAQDPGLYVEPPHSFPLETALEILNGKIMGQSLPSGIPWHANPTGELEWPHFLNRHHFLRTLIQDYVTTGNKSSMQMVLNVLEDWIQNCPVPINSNGGAGPTWETLTVAWRLREWFWVKGILWNAESFPKAVKSLMLRSVWEHARSLMDHQGHPNNWMIVESAALACAGMIFPELKQANRWVETGIKRLAQEHDRQFFDDSSHFEISTLYHAICIHSILEVRIVAEAVGVPLPLLFYEPLEKSFQYLMDIARPDFTWPSINDSGSFDRDYCQLFARAAHIFNRSDFKWVATKGIKGEPPNRNFCCFPDSGICVIKGTEKKEKKWGLFRAGPAGAFHVHNDVLSIEIFDRKFPWLVDPGITKYAPDPLTSKYRSGLFHNILTVDGVEPTRSTARISERIKSVRDKIQAFEKENSIAVFGVSHELLDKHGNSCSLERGLVLYRNSFWVLFEHVSGKGIHDIVHNWQFSHHVKSVRLAEPFKIIASNEYSQLVIEKLMPDEPSKFDTVRGGINPLRGWVSVGGTDKASYSVRCKTLIELPALFCWTIHGCWNSN